MEVSFESRKKPIWNSFSSTLWVYKFWMKKKKITYLWMPIYLYFFGVPCIGHVSRLCLFIICFASEQTSCLNEANRIDLPGFFSIPCSHQASKECTMFHAVLMNGATPACSSVLRLFATSVFLQAENVSRLSSPGTSSHVETNLSSVFSLWQCKDQDLESLMVLSLIIVLLSFIVTYKQYGWWSLAFRDIKHIVTSNREGFASREQ